MDVEKFKDETPVEIETGPAPTASVIWLHGLGADGHDFEPIVPELDLPEALALRFVFPHAPYRPVTINGGHVMRAWYDMALAERGVVQNAEDIRAAEEIIRQLIQNENARGIAPGRIVLAGFSQGGAVALHTGLRYPQRLAGILALSTLPPDVDELARTARRADTGIPVFMAHGRNDPLIPFALAREAARRLAENGMSMEWHEYAMAHGVVPEEIADISRWLTRILGAGAPG